MATGMTHRQPKFDFTGVPPLWAECPEFALFFVASSTGAPAVEPYINQVMAEARKTMTDPALRAEIEMFIKQETAHYKVHAGYNKEMSQHYPFLKEFEEAKRQDYKRFLTQESHKFNCAYAAGFETLALSMAIFLFTKSGKLLGSADQRTLDMWQWHLAEEYEHRSVCHEVYNHLYGDSWYRAKMVIFTFKHLAGHNRKALSRLLAEFRKDMTPQEKEASIKREKAFKRQFAMFHLKHVVRLLMPGYDPSKAKPPKGLPEFLGRFQTA